MLTIQAQAQAVFTSLQGNRFALDILRDHAIMGAAQLAIFRAAVAREFALANGLPESTGIATMQKAKVPKVSTFSTYCARLSMFHKGADGFKGISFYAKEGKRIVQVTHSIETVPASVLVSNQERLKAEFEAQERGDAPTVKAPVFSIADAIDAIKAAHKVGALCDGDYAALASVKPTPVANVVDMGAAVIVTQERIAA